MNLRLRFLLLALPIAAGLAVPFYNRGTPTLGGWPFFYWWQTACVLAGALLTGAAYWLDERKAFSAESHSAPAGKGRAE